MKWLKWILKGRPTIKYEGFHCGICGAWIDKKFEMPTYKSNGKWADTWEVCDECFGGIK